MATPVRHPPFREQLLVQLREMIVRGELAPGTHLVEGWVADTFGVSRGPVRDALRQLEIESLVHTGKRGVLVSGLRDEDVVELYSLRSALESLAVREMMARLDQLSWGVLDEAVGGMQAAADAEDPMAFAAADLDFHSGFYVLAGHRRLAATWATYRPLFAVMLGITNTRDRDLRPVVQVHADLKAVIQSGEVEPALAELQSHLDGACRRMRTSLAELAWTSPE